MEMEVVLKWKQAKSGNGNRSGNTKWKQMIVCFYDCLFIVSKNLISKKLISDYYY